MTHIELYDSTTVDQLTWPDTEEAHAAHALLLPMIKEGVPHYIRNVETKLYLMLVNSQVIPLTVNQREYDNSYLTSNYFPIKHLEEKKSQKKHPLNILQKPLLKGVGFFLKGIKINKVVIVNNWLLTTNIYPILSQKELRDVTAFLTQRFKDHALVFRSLNIRKCQELADHLNKLSYRLLYARHVYIYDPSQKDQFSSKVHYHHRRDRRLIGSEGYEVVLSDGEMQASELDRLLELYNALYLARHTTFSPQYTEKYLRKAVEKRFLHLVGLKKEGKIHAVIGFHQRAETLITPFCGFDRTLGDVSHLYRMLTILAIDEAEARGLLLNDGSGGEAPKQYRGMKPFPEYVALYDKHLPLHRRLFWSLAEKIVKKMIVKPN